MKMNYITRRSATQSVVSDIIHGAPIISEFIPYKPGEYLFERAFLYNLGDYNTNSLTRPFASVTVFSETCELLEYKDVVISDFADTEKWPLDISLDASVPVAETAVEQGNLIAELHDFYDEMIPFVFEPVSTAEQKNIIIKWFDLFKKTIPDSLKPFYEALSPDFFCWVNNSVSDK
ncbi:MAG: hypothetical protein K6G90_11060 [Clostridia bacterium]|nr:hypothetical protein [Clostridia bacterium]